jgi:hypothetical protein
MAQFIIKKTSFFNVSFNDLVGMKFQNALVGQN